MGHEESFINREDPYLWMHRNQIKRKREEMREKSLGVTLGIPLGLPLLPPLLLLPWALLRHPLAGVKCHTRSSLPSLGCLTKVLQSEALSHFPAKSDVRAK